MLKLPVPEYLGLDSYSNDSLYGYTATQMHDYAAQVCAERDVEIETMNTTITWATTHIEAIIAERDALRAATTAERKRLNL